MTKLEMIKKREEFVAIAKKGEKVSTAGLVLQVMQMPESGVSEVIKTGFTATRKIGNAVFRNRVKRRLRALSREIIAKHAKAGRYYVLIGRTRTFDRDFTALEKDLKYALHATGSYENVS